jgi:hypothetical protein
MANVYIRRRPASVGSNRVQDWALVILAIWLFISPWVLQFGGGVVAPAAGGANPPFNVAAEVSRAAWNAWVIGVILFLLMLSAVGQVAASQEWFALILGAWTFVAPWILGFVLLGRASWDHWIVGALVFLIAAWNIWSLRNVPYEDSVTAPPHGV